MIHVDHGCSLGLQQIEAVKSIVVFDSCSVGVFNLAAKEFKSLIIN